MKSTMKRIVIPVLIAILFILGVIWWFQASAKALNISAKNVSKVSIFDGTTGKGVELTEEADIDYFMNNLNALQMKRRGLSLGYMGYRFKVTITEKNGGQIAFIINSANDVRKDPFFYSVEEGEIDIDFIESIFSK